jgi:hypothetical protein
MERIFISHSAFGSVLKMEPPPSFQNRCYVLSHMYTLYIYQHSGFFVHFFVIGLRSFKTVNYNKFTTDWRGTRGFPTSDEFNYFKNILLLSGNKTL